MAANNKLCCTLALGALLCLGLAALIQAQGEWQPKTETQAELGRFGLRQKTASTAKSMEIPVSQICAFH